MRRVLYPGSFDPVTNGHLDVAKRASKIFDEVLVAVAANSEKKALFSIEERMELFQTACKDIPNIKVITFKGLMVDAVDRFHADAVIRGIRAASDFEYEFQIDAVNRHLMDDIRTVYFMASPSHSFLSSSNVKEIGGHGGSIMGLVPKCNEEFIRERLARQ